LVIEQNVEQPSSLREEFPDKIGVGVAWRSNAFLFSQRSVRCTPPGLWSSGVPEMPSWSLGLLHLLVRHGVIVMSAQRRM